MLNIHMLTVYITGFVLIHLIWLLTDYHTPSERLQTFIHADFTGVYLVQAVTIGLQLIQVAVFPLPRTALDGWLEISGLLLFAAGTTLAVWAKLTMGRHWGHPGTFDPVRQRRMVTSGPFTISRNPIYTGILLFVTGFSVGIRTVLLPLNLVLFIYIDRMIKTEEALLSDQFGVAYERYARRVRRYL